MTFHGYYVFAKKNEQSLHLKDKSRKDPTVIAGEPFSTHRCHSPCSDAQTYRLMNGFWLAHSQNVNAAKHSLEKEL